jgi:hypothetical protein
MNEALDIALCIGGWVMLVVGGVAVVAIVATVCQSVRRR